MTRQRSNQSVKRRTTAVRLVALTLVAVVGATMLPGAAQAAGNAAYDVQQLHETALYKINGPDNAGGQELVTADNHIDVVSAWVESQSSTGTLTAQLRTTITDETTAVATASVDIASLGGAGSGWVDFPLDADVEAGALYYLVLQASTSESGRIAWFGTRTAVAGGMHSWNYDLPYWGG